MDDDMVTTLRAAFEASPNNAKLLKGLLLALDGRGELASAGPLLARATKEGLDLGTVEGSDDRELFAKALFKSGQAAEALPLTRGDEPSLLLLRARILVSLERQSEAREAYERAVELNAALQDLELESLLKAKVRTIEGRGQGPALRVIANDDTDQSELLRVLQPNQEKVTFSDVGGLSEIKKQIERKIILPFKKPSIFQRFKRRAGGGILLYGPPGCGKTLLARATAGECQAEFFNVAISDILDMYIGESERKLHALFDKARASAPTVLFFDELEALAGKRQYTRESTSSKLVSQFLSEMDGFAQNNAGVLILGATNVPWAVDAAFRRPGRFDRVLFVPPPDRDARAEILRGLLSEVPKGPDVEVIELAKKTQGYSGADLRNLVETASDEAIEASLEAQAEVPIGQRALLSAMRAVKPTTLEWLTTAKNYARYANESGQYDDVLEFLRKHGKS